MKRLRGNAADEVDWSAGHAHLARGAAAWAEALSPTPERARLILDERARCLALAPAQPRQSQSSAAVVFTRARGRFAIETQFVREVFHPGETMPVPGAPAFVHGVANFRGELLVLVDLCRVLGLGEPDAGPARDALVLGEDEVAFGIIADEVLAVTSIAADALPDLRSAHGAMPAQVVRGITVDGLVMLDGAALLADRRLVIGESEAAPALPAARGIGP